MCGLVIVEFLENFLLLLYRDMCYSALRPLLLTVSQSIKWTMGAFVAIARESSFTGGSSGKHCQQTFINDVTVASHHNIVNKTVQGLNCLP